ncbi:MAG TPA: hypothetical protein VMT54_09850 [Candidatus Cybelea sp.]|nr:hypothetical protein [Candidatus Cybelea sp.]
MFKSGLFAGLRRRRSALGGIFAYLLLLNGMLATLVSGQLPITAGGPIAALAAAPLCDPQGSLSGDASHGSGQHQTPCPICDAACPMDACAPVAGTPLTIAAVTPPQAAPIAQIDGAPETLHPRSVHLSDRRAQAPPVFA